MRVALPNCPKCGEPPRYVIGIFRVKVGYQKAKDGSLAPTGEQRIIKPVADAVLTLECGGGHRWDTTEVV